ncbi:hypothetical protein FCJ61_23765 [Burkholderia metallica]|nr:hypothetical protein [Burkholderia metallica]NTZ85936.1 hypothetical protein [Burkholderia metallica]
MATHRGKRCGRHRSASPFVKWKVNMPRAGSRPGFQSGVPTSRGVAYLKGLMYPGFVCFVRVCSCCAASEHACAAARPCDAQSALTIAPSTRMFCPVM